MWPIADHVMGQTKEEEGTIIAMAITPAITWNEDVDISASVSTLRPLHARKQSPELPRTTRTSLRSTASSRF
ncbi:hypothetical protein E2C01_082642 [Portunus trituberculatus]|uniref:Uncharacterized protein n=1 Tax=Portunus trituberculatus TaxID=210409 RepID=A0A5B7IZN8_PORTR|nr:hypothetical protein [Portunus trituberculatus]